MSDPAVVAALIAAAISLLVAALTAYFTVWTNRRQRTVDLIVAALSHMTGGIQERGAGLAALSALGASTQRQGWFERATWKAYSTAVGQHIYRQLIYVLNHGEKGKVHEVENLLFMLTLLTEDRQMRDSCSAEQRERLMLSLESWRTSAPSSLGNTPLSRAIDEMEVKIPSWNLILS